MFYPCWIAGFALLSQPPDGLQRLRRICFGNDWSPMPFPESCLRCNIVGGIPLSGLRFINRQYCFYNFFLTVKAKTVHVLDTNAVDLCLSLFDWTLFRKIKIAATSHKLVTCAVRFPLVFTLVSTRCMRLKHWTLSLSKQVFLCDGAAIRTSPACIGCLRFKTMRNYIFGWRECFVTIVHQS